MSTTLHAAESERWTLSHAEVAQLLNVSRRHVYALNASGRIPSPIRLGRRTVWAADELRAWLAAGAPDRSEWEALRQAQPGLI